MVVIAGARVGLCVTNACCTHIDILVVGPVSFVLLVAASWCVGEGGEILGQKYDASIIGGLIIAWLNTGMSVLITKMQLTTIIAPEAIFFITALSSSNPRFAVGAVSGSTIGKFFVLCSVVLLFVDMLLVL